MDSTLIILWVFTWVAIGLIVLRLLLRKLKGRQFILGDYFAMGAILCALVRLALVHVILIWGTNNMLNGIAGSSRYFFSHVSFSLWLQKLVLLDTYRRLLTNLRWEKATMISYIGIFAATYIIVQIVTFTECDPFSHYWMVLPDPGICCRAQLQLIVVSMHSSNIVVPSGVLNVITDIMLIALPIPILVLVKRSTIEKIQLAALFAVGLFIVAITIARLPQNAKNSTAQVNRTTWASIELLAAAIVANAPVLYGLLKGQSERSKNAASGAGSTGPSQGIKKRPANEPEFELQRTRHSKRGSALGSRISSRNYLEIDGESSQSLTRSLEN
ncbi:Pc13g04940 [Penicillium rubens Wisconsin 54-1255]|uniref:Pc13g04940 protein n=1 Tax=Penicillium rubens (strain ATCC 28089 / DSM 1075 / NRRL 1951 / Wisconsin 54-1255) TaxID=500485 RepID=B6H2D6_PENRW|nr:Pc13g04940 [Penicillium rubens Wisconsin 54-1255]